MNIFTNVITLVGLIWMITLFLDTDKMKKWRKYLIIGTIFIAIFHFLLEGFRWQLVPVYVLLGLLFALHLYQTGIKQSEERSKAWVRVLGAIVIFLTVTVSFLLSYLFPNLSYASPSGAYSVGTDIYYFTDNSRSERPIVTQVWYPAEAKGRIFYAPIHPHPDILGEHLSTIYGIPGGVFGQFGKKSYSMLNAAILPSDQPYPFLLFSHGLYGNRTQNTFLMEELASQGYIVVGIDHPYLSSGVVLEDGTPVDPQVVNIQILPLDRIADSIIRDWSLDTRFVLDQFLKMNSEADSLFYGAIDEEKIGYFGHSMGGSAVMKALATEPRIKAGINIDGFPFGLKDREDLTATQPFLILRSYGNTLELNDQQARGTEMTGAEYTRNVLMEWDDRVDTITGNATKFVVHGAGHFDYTMLSLLSPLVAGSQEPAVIHDMLSELTLAFFGEHLLGYPTHPVFSSPSEVFSNLQFYQSPYTK